MCLGKRRWQTESASPQNPAQYFMTTHAATHPCTFLLEVKTNERRPTDPDSWILNISAATQSIPQLRLYWPVAVTPPSALLTPADDSPHQQAAKLFRPENLNLANVVWNPSLICLSANWQFEIYHQVDKVVAWMKQLVGDSGTDSSGGTDNFLRFWKSRPPLTTPNLWSTFNKAPQYTVTKLWEAIK